MVESLARRSPICWSMSDTGPRTSSLTATDSSWSAVGVYALGRSRCALSVEAPDGRQREWRGTELPRSAAWGGADAAEGDAGGGRGPRVVGLNGTCRTFGTRSSRHFLVVPTQIDHQPPYNSGLSWMPYRARQRPCA